MGRQKVVQQAGNHIKLIDELFAVLNAEEIETLSILLKKLSQRAKTLKE
jgi:hypothetical protein